MMQAQVQQEWIVGVAILLMVLLVVKVVVRIRRGSNYALQAVCMQCATPFQSRFHHTLIGFRKMTCPSCGVRSTYPLSRRRYGVYLFLFFGSCLTLLQDLARNPGGVPFFGGLGCAILYGITRHNLLWLRLSKVAAQSPDVIDLLRRVKAVPQQQAGVPPQFTVPELGGNRPLLAPKSGLPLLPSSATGRQTSTTDIVAYGTLAFVIIASIVVIVVAAVNGWEMVRR
jgi:hypothetical protein